MAVELRSTAGFVQEGVKVLVYGQAGAGKTRLIQTLPTPVIISAEGGLLSLREEFSIFSLARRDGGRIAGLVIAHACDGDGWERTRIREVLTVELADRLGAVAEE